MSIPLPPIPEPYIDTWPLTPEKLRARDLEVARLVLEAVAGWIKTQRMVTPANGYEFSSSIRTLEFKHHE